MDAKEINRQVFEFIGKCQKRGIPFDQAFDLWLDLAPLRSSQVIDFGYDEDIYSDTGSLPALPLGGGAGPSNNNLPLKSSSDVLTLEEVCDYLSISRASLYRLDIPGKFKVGGQVRFLRSTIDEWVRKQAGL